MRAIIFAILLASCTTVPDPPPHSFRMKEGTTYANDVWTAEEYCRLATQISKQVRAILGIEEFEPFELRIDDNPVPESGMGAVATVRWYTKDGPLTSYIRFSEGGALERERVLAHELVHWHIGAIWGLPLVVEEGLADIVSARLDADGAAFLRFRRRMARAGLRDEASVLRAGNPLQIDRSSWPELSVQDQRLLYGFGVLLAEDIGIAGFPCIDLADIEQRAEDIVRSVLEASPVPGSTN